MKTGACLKAPFGDRSAVARAPAAQATRSHRYHVTLYRDTWGVTAYTTKKNDGGATRWAHVRTGGPKDNFWQLRPTYIRILDDPPRFEGERRDFRTTYTCLNTRLRKWRKKPPNRRRAKEAYNSARRHASEKLAGQICDGEFADREVNLFLETHQSRVNKAAAAGRTLRRATGNIPRRRRCKDRRKAPQQYHSATNGPRHTNFPALEKNATDRHRDGARSRRGVEHVGIHLRLRAPPPVSDDADSIRTIGSSAEASGMRAAPGVPGKGVECPASRFRPRRHSLRAQNRRRLESGATPTNYAQTDHTTCTWNASTKQRTIPHSYQL